MIRIELKSKLVMAFIFSIMLLFPAFLSAQNSGTSKSSKFEVYPVKDLTMELKKDVNLTDKQTPKVMKILRKYEANTYDAKGNKSDIKEAAKDAKKDIADILTKTQKTEWKKDESQWWASVNKELNVSGLSMNKNMSNNMNKKMNSSMY